MFIEERIAELSGQFSPGEVVTYTYRVDPPMVRLAWRDQEIDLTPNLPPTPADPNNPEASIIDWETYLAGKSEGGPLTALYQFGKGLRIDIRLIRL